MSRPSMIWVTAFILDIVSTWFTVYSTYLAGPRTEKVSSTIESLILAPYRNNIISNISIESLADLWIAS